MEGETEEHDVVINTLKEVDPSRKCFRSVGGILVERTVGEVLPALQTNREQVVAVSVVHAIFIALVEFFLLYLSVLSACLPTPVHQV